MCPRRIPPRLTASGTSQFVAGIHSICSPRLSSSVSKFPHIVKLLPPEKWASSLMGHLCSGDRGSGDVPWRSIWSGQRLGAPLRLGGPCGYCLVCWLECWVTRASPSDGMWGDLHQG